MADEEPRSGCLFSILRLFEIRVGSSTPIDDALPFRQRDDFLSPAERSFYGVLHQVVAEQGVICPRVRVMDLLFVVNRNSNMSHVNRIDRRHVDMTSSASLLRSNLTCVLPKL